jgi:hypothetical protein
VSVRDLKEHERRFVEESNKGKVAALAVIDELYAPNCVLHAASGQDVRGLENVKKHISEFYDAFPGNHMTIDDLIVEGDKAVVRYTFTGTHKGEYRGIPSTNKNVTIWAIEIHRIVGGKRVESWSRYDTLGVMQQLGLIPTPGKGK